MPGLRKGYPGLTHTAEQIANFIGECDVFVEPFAGLGRVSSYIKANKIILNDKSEYAYAFLKENFKDAIVTNDDFLECLRKYDNTNVTFFCDPPWNRKDYADNPKTFCDRGIGDYYKQLFDFLTTCKARWFVAGRAGGGSRATANVYFKDFAKTVIESKRTINKHPIKTLLVYEKTN